MTEKFKKKHLIIELDKKTFDIVFKTFNYLTDNIENHAIVESNRLLVDKENGEDIIEMFKIANDEDKILKTIHMNTHDWYSYVNMVSYSAYVLPLPFSCCEEDEVFLERYSDYIDKQEEAHNFYDEKILKRVSFIYEIKQLEVTRMFLF